MERNSLVELVRQCLGAIRGGLDVAEMATAEIGRDVHSTDLRDALLQGHEMSKVWSSHCDEAVMEVGGDLKKENPVLKAHYAVSRRIRQEALDENARDLGIIANGQCALHYWIAAFGTLRTYSQATSLPKLAQTMETCLQEAKDADEQFSQIAVRILGASPDLKTSPDMGITSTSRGMEARQ